jgi:hypothetical protein
VSHDAPLLVLRRCKGCGEELRARVHAVGADVDDALWVAEGLSKIAACPRCESQALGTLFGAAIWDGATLWFATFVSLSLVAGLIGAGFLGSGIAAAIGVALAFVTALSVGVRKGRATIMSIREDANERVFWFFCVECKKGIADGREPWMTCERCHRAVHEPCAMAHVTSHVALTAYRGSSSSEEIPRHR